MSRHALDPARCPGDPASTDPAIMARYVRVTTAWHRAWARQLGTFQAGQIVAFALVDATGHDLGQVLLADTAELVLEPAVLLADRLHLAPRPVAAATGSLSVFPLDLRGLEVLVAEDEPVIALCLEQTLRDLGCTVLGPVSSVAETLALLGSVRPDVALLDVHMLDGAITPVAAWLTRSGVPLVVTTADETADHEPALSGAVLLPKPYSVGAIRQAIKSLKRNKTTSTEAFDTAISLRGVAEEDCG